MTIQNKDIKIKSEDLGLQSIGLSSKLARVESDPRIATNNKQGFPYKLRRMGMSKDTSDIPEDNSNFPLKSCIFIPKGGNPDERISVKKSKSVHFADSLGKPLKSVKTLYDSNDDFLDMSLLSLKGTTRRTFPVDIFKKNYNNSFGNIQEKSKLLNFKQPITSKDFNAKVECQNVSLENVVFREYGVFATIIVKNISFAKEITVRYTFDKWNSFKVIKANFVQGSSTGSTDTFSCEIFPPISKDKSTEIQFAICYAANGNTYWDSNDGNNYIIKFCPKTSEKDKFNDEVTDCTGFILPRQSFLGWSS